jgi:hypothetical protein
VPFDLAVQSTRPGIAYQPVELDLSWDLAADVERRAAECGLSAAVWGAVTIEAERALRQACQAMPSRRHEVIQALDRAAETGTSSIASGPGGRLLAYATQLRSARHRPVAQTRERLSLPVPYNCLLGWRHAAAAQGQRVEDWAHSVLASETRHALLWEAAAAESGATLAEWTLLQAARACSCSSAVAHRAG